MQYVCARSYAWAFCPNPRLLKPARALPLPAVRKLRRPQPNRASRAVRKRRRRPMVRIPTRQKIRPLPQLAKQVRLRPRKWFPKARYSSNLSIRIRMAVSLPLSSSLTARARRVARRHPRKLRSVQRLAVIPPLHRPRLTPRLKATRPKRLARPRHQQQSLRWHYRIQASLFPRAHERANTRPRYLRFWISITTNSSPGRNSMS